MKKIIKAMSAVTLSALLAVTAAVPSIVPVTKAEAAPSPIVKYDFENGTGMSSSGIAGSTAPTVVDDAERGKVLQFAAGETSQLLQMKDDSSLGEYDTKLSPGTPSSLSFPNPFAGKSLSGVTIAYWLKIPSEEAASKGSGIVGFISEQKTIQHPDKLVAQSKGDNNKDSLADGHGQFSYGISCAYVDPVAVNELPMVYFAGLHHNTYNFMDEEGALLDKVNKWVFVVVSQTNSYASVYVDGKEISGGGTDGHGIKNKRWNDGEVNGGAEGNVGQPKFTDIVTESGTKAYVGYTGFSPTVAGVCIDDLMFFDTAISAADASALYTSAQSGEIAATGSSSGNSSSNTNSTSSDAKKQAAAEAAAKAAAEAAAKEAAAQAANKALTDALVSSVSVSGMKGANPTVAGVYRGDAAYTSLVDKLNGVTLRSGYRVADVVGANISFGGTQPETVATISMNLPSGFDASLVEVVRINDDGTVSKLNKTIENGVIKAKTNHFSTYAVVLLEAGTGASSNLPNSGAASSAAVAGFGVAAVVCGAVLVIRRKKVEA